MKIPELHQLLLLYENRDEANCAKVRYCADDFSSPSIDRILSFCGPIPQEVADYYQLGGFSFDWENVCDKHWGFEGDKFGYWVFCRYPCSIEDFSSR